MADSPFLSASRRPIFNAFTTLLAFAPLPLSPAGRGETETAMTPMLRWTRRAALLIIPLSLLLMLLESGYQAALADDQVQAALAAEKASSGARKDPPAKKKDDAPVAYRGARIYTASGPVIDVGVLVVHKGKIVDVGPVDAVKIPAAAKVRDVKGLVIIPGLVDSHSHIGIFQRPGVPAHADGNEVTNPL